MRTFMLVVVAACSATAGPITLMPNGFLGDSRGNAFIPLGGFYANWPGNGTAEDRVILPPHDLMPPGAATHVYPFSAEQEAALKAWFAFCQRNEINTLRLMLRAMDIVGRVHPNNIQAVLRYLDLAKPYGIRFQVVLFEDMDKPPYVNLGVLETFIKEYPPNDIENLPAHRRRFLVEKRVATDKYHDADVLACQKDYLREIIPMLRDRDEIFAYELENEMACAPEWVREITREIRALDDTRPIIANPVDISYPVSLRFAATGVDLLNYHPYQHGNPRSGTNAYYMVRAKHSMCALPTYPGEAALNRTTGDRVGEWEASLLIRDHIWNGILGGYIGALMWVPQYKGEVEEFSKASRILREFDIRDFSRKKADIVVVLPEIDHEDEIQHLHAMMRWAEFSQATGYDFDFTMNPAERRAVTVMLGTDIRKVDLSGLERPFATTPGYMIQYLISVDESKAVVMLGNRAGGIKEGVSRCWQRARKPVSCALRLDLPPGRYQLTIHNLDRPKAKRTIESSGSEWVSLGRSEDDFVIIVKREER